MAKKPAKRTNGNSRSRNDNRNEGRSEKIKTKTRSRDDVEEYDNTDRGVLFKNNRKNSDKHPDMSGNINVDGVEYWLSAWSQKPRGGGDKFLVLRVTPKDSDVNDNRDEDDEDESENDLPF